MRIWLRSHLWEEQVLIESDWNLKVIETEEPPVVVASINRIRLEFKVITGNHAKLLHGRINRSGQVLIESDWNLKLGSFISKIWDDTSY